MLIGRKHKMIVPTTSTVVFSALFFFNKSFNFRFWKLLFYDPLPVKKSFTIQINVSYITIKMTLKYIVRVMVCIFNCYQPLAS